jgi:hypothetical protein
MTSQHPIHPPTELVQELWDRLRKAPESGASAAIAWTEAVARAAQWGADRQLDECCERLLSVAMAEELRAACRPKPPSLKEQALTQLSSVETVLRRHGVINTEHIRCALELLPDDTTP